MGMVLDWDRGTAEPKPRAARVSENTRQCVIATLAPTCRDAGHPPKSLTDGGLPLAQGGRCVRDDAMTR